MIPRAAIPYLWMTVVFLLSSVPAGDLPVSPIRGADKVIHCLLYGVLVLAFRPAAASRRLPGEWLPGAVAAALVFAMFDEVHQSWVPGRRPGIREPAIDDLALKRHQAPDVARVRRQYHEARF